MNELLTDITIVLDCSGSMQHIASDMEGALNAFIEDQKKVPGGCAVTLYTFSDKCQRVFTALPLGSIQPIKIKPDGYTAYFEALGTAIEETGQRLARIPENDRPAKVIVIVITDGMNNVNGKFTRDQVRQMVELQQNTYSWQFVYLGANHDSFKAAAEVGFLRSSIMDYAHNSEGTVHLSASLSRATSVYRMAASNQPIAFTDEDRAKQAAAGAVSSN